MKFVNKYGKSCRYKFGDKVICLTDIEQEIYTIIDAKWIGNSNGFWEIFMEDERGRKFSRLRLSHFKKVGSIYK